MVFSPMIALLSRVLKQTRGGDKGSAAIMIASLLPCLLAAAAVTIDASSWGVLQTEMQRAATLAAQAGAKEYNLNTNAQKAATAAAASAQVNGVTGASSPTWNSGTNTLTSNNVTAQIVTGVTSSSNKAIKVTVTGAAVNAFAPIISNNVYTVSASATAEIIPQLFYNSCLVALSTAGGGVSVGGSVILDATGCAVFSNSVISFNGSVTATASAFLAKGAISTSGNPTITGSQTPNSGATNDPYATYAPLQTAFANAASASGANVKTTKTIDPGSYNGFNLNGGTLTLNPGLYLVGGDISLAGGATIAGTGVTIVLTGTVSMTGNSIMTLAAASPSTAVNGAIAGVVLAGNGSSSQSVGGTNASTFTGVVYFPNAPLIFGGTSTVNGYSGCLELIAASISFSGNPEVAPNCSSLGVLPLNNTSFNQSRSVK